MGKTWLKEDSIDPHDDSVRAYLLSIERDFNKKREQLFYKTQAYFRQAISSNYISENDLRKLIDECDDLKKQYLDYKLAVSKIRGTTHII